jgi:hypothetical protein
MIRQDIYVEDAQKGLYEIKKAREAALGSEIHTWLTKSEQEINRL